MSFRSAIVERNFVLKDLEEKAKKAKTEKKIFIIMEGYEPLRQSLLARDWIEKIPDDKLSLIPSTSEKFVNALLLKNFPFFFVWQPRSRPIRNQHNVKPCINSISRQRALDFTTKDGLQNCVENYRWHHIEDVTEISYQRSHVLVDKTARDEFCEDYRRTAIISFIMNLNEAGSDFHFFFTTDDNSISTECITFSIQKIDLLIKTEQHEDLDTSQVFDVCAKFPNNQKELLVRIRQITNGTKKFKFESNLLMETWKETIHECAEKIQNQWPLLKYDGFKNVWIIKPIGASSGFGVKVMNSEEAILLATQTSQPKCIVQKYVEKPLLIHNRKFDMRIYFITFIREDFVDVWLYKDCYVKFGTNIFSLDNLHQSIHVTNYAVQKNFMNSLDSVENSKENMWPLDELIKHFEKIGKPNIWRYQIYPAIKKNLLSVILQSLEVTDLQPNNFELNGADFMIGYDFQPILIEVNSRPALFFSRTVIELITNKLLEDLVKVTVDWQRDNSSLTGDFELIYCYEIPKVENTKIDLSINGTRIERNIPRARLSDEQERAKKPKTNKDDFKNRSRKYPIYFREVSTKFLKN